MMEDKEKLSQLPIEIMKKAVKGISYIGHPLRLKILEYIDVNGKSSVSTISKALNTEQVIVSQNLKKMKEFNLLTAEKDGIFVYYSICSEYPASIFVCIRKLFGLMSGKYRFIDGNYKAILPEDYTTMVANRIKLFANYDKMRILEFLLINGSSNVSQIIKGINSNQLKVSQYLKRLKDDEFIKCKKDGRFCFYEIVNGVHKTSIQCIHKRYNSLKNKNDF